MTKQQLREAIRKIIRQELSENAPSPSKPTPTKEPAIAPGKPAKKEPRRPLGNPEVPKKSPSPAKMEEASKLKDIIQRFRNKK